MEELPKVKRILTPEHLEKLKISREKAIAARVKMGIETKLKKELKNAEHEAGISEVKQKLQKLKEPPQPVISSSEEDEPVVIKKKPKKKKKVVVIEQTDSDEEQTIVYVKKPKPIKESIIQQIEISEAPVVAQAPVTTGRRTYVDPTAIYNSFYQRNLNR